MVNRTLLYPLILFIFFFACTRDSSPLSDITVPSNPRPDCNFCEILFIGSSYLSIAGNDVVDLFSQLTDEGKKLTYIDKIAISGFKLKDHSENPETLLKIRSNDWDYVILQGNSAYPSKPEWHYMVVPYLKKLRDEIKKHSEKACVIYMMPWAYEDGLTFIEGETDDYEQMQLNLYSQTIYIAKSLDVALAPAGWTWYRAINAGFDKKLYLNDFNHQSGYGAYLTACVFYSSIFLERAPVIDFEWELNDDPEYFQNLAYSIVIDSLEDWNIY